MENIQRLLGGGGDREGGDREGGGEEDREEVVANIEEGVVEEDNRIEPAENISPKKSHKVSAKKKTASSLEGRKSGEKTNRRAAEEMEGDTTNKEDNVEEDNSGIITKEKDIKDGEERKKAEPVKKSDIVIDKRKTGGSSEDEDFVPQKKTRKLRESSDKIHATPAPEKPGKRGTRKIEKEEESFSNTGDKVGKKTSKHSKSKERMPSGTKDQGSPVTPANNALKLKGSNTPIGFNLTTPSNLSSRGTPTTPATLEKKNKKGETALQTAVIKGEETTVRQLLEAGACPNTRDNAGWTPLHEARGRPELVEMLLEADALPSVPAGDDRMTALHEAALAGQAEVVRLLVRHGADREARDRMGRTPGQLAQGHAKVLTVLENEPHVSPKPSGVRPQGSPCVVLMKEYRSKLTVGETTTHLVASQDQADHVQWLAAVIVGAEIVGESWLKEGGVGEEEGHRLEAEGLEVSRAWRAALQPKLLSGLHIYFKGTFSSPTKVELQILARLGGATVLNRWGNLLKPTITIFL